MNITMPNISLVLVIILLVIGAASPSTAADANDRYVNKALGWTMIIPAGWRRMSSAEVHAAQVDGHQVVKRAGKNPVKSPASLLSLQDPDFDTFFSTCAPYHGDVNVPIVKEVQDSAERTARVLRHYGVKTSYSLGSKIIDGRRFVTVQLVGRSARNRPLVYEYDYDRIIGDCAFQAAIMVGNRARLKSISRAWLNSKFTQ